MAAEPESADYWSTLGVALYRAGKYGECGNALEKAMKLRPGCKPVDWFFVAMALHRCGHRDQALTWFEKGRTWLLQEKSPDPDVQAWCDEAGDLLGIPKAPK